MTNNLLSENIAEVVASKNLDDIMSTLTTHLKVSVEQLNKDDGNEHSIDMIFEIVKVFQILGLSKDIEHRQLVLTSEVLDLVYKLFNQSKSDDIFL